MRVSYRICHRQRKGFVLWLLNIKECCGFPGFVFDTALERGGPSGTSQLRFLACLADECCRVKSEISNLRLKLKYLAKTMSQ
jgi:hypothetical protein